MSESQSALGSQEEDKGPQTTQEIVKEIFVRILAGLGAVGRGFRGGFISTATCVQRSVYPVKEGCLHGYDQVHSYFHPASARAGVMVPAEEVVHFTQAGSVSSNSEPLSDEY